MKICVVGLGKIGLPLAVQYATKGHAVRGVDVNPEVVRKVNSGVEPFPGEDNLQSRLSDVVQRGLLFAETDTKEAVSASEAVVIVVPLFVDEAGQPDFSAMDAATEAVGSGLQAGTLVSYETTLPVGTTRLRYAPMLSARSGLVAGVDFDVVFSPERVLTGRVFADLRRYPKLVGGLDAVGEQRGVQFYSDVLDFDVRDDLPRENGPWSMGSAEAAEMAKLAETTYRDVNIGLANQFARYADTVGVEIQAVIEACNSQPFSHIHQPGIAVGGHCIPVYPRLYLFNDPSATVVQSARETNAAMPSYAVGRLRAAYGDLAGARVAVLGAAYRGAVKETAFSGVFDIIAELESYGAAVTVHDPMYEDAELRSHGWTAYHMGDPVDAAVVQADHPEYFHLRPEDLPGVRVVLDGRRVIGGTAWRNVPVLWIGGSSQ